MQFRADLLTNFMTDFTTAVLVRYTNHKGVSLAPRYLRYIYIYIIIIVYLCISLLATQLLPILLDGFLAGLAEVEVDGPCRAVPPADLPQGR